MITTGEKEGSKTKFSSTLGKHKQKAQEIMEPPFVLSILKSPFTMICYFMDRQWYGADDGIVPAMILYLHIGQ